jgi:glucose-6-phosphate 1-dehydrogenase
VRASSLSAHARLILDCFNGSHSGFVRCDEFMEAWKVFDDVLREIQENLIVPISYTFGSSGPLEATLRAAEAGYK